MTACLQLEPSIQSGGWDFGYRNVHGSQEIVLGALASRLAHLLEETTQSSNSTDLIQSRDGVHDAAFVVVVPNVQVEGVRIDVINVAVVDRTFLNFTFNFQWVLVGLMVIYGQFTLIHSLLKIYTCYHEFMVLFSDSKLSFAAPFDLLHDLWSLLNCSNFPSTLCWFLRKNLKLH